MESLIVMSLVLAILQIWIIPMVLNMKHMNWLLSNREDSDEPSEMLARARRASTNLQESLPAFLALALLSMIISVDVTCVAFPDRRCQLEHQFNVSPGKIHNF